MALCVDGHQTQAQDFCDQCGMPVAEAKAPSQPMSEPGLPSCPHCGAPHVRDSLFCESCGYDYTTGALPAQDLRTELGLPPLPGEPERKEGTAPDIQANPTGPDSPDVAQANEPREETTVHPSPPDPVRPRPMSPSQRHLPWVAEVWVDPQWYAFQESDDALPPQGAPRIVPIGDSALIGRRSLSRNIHPDIDCGSDPGVSRRQAFLTSADGYWYVNDLDSANGTFVADATGSLPDEAITGRIQVGPDKRIFVGGWTRIVVRPALPAEIASAQEPRQSPSGGTLPPEQV